MLYGSKFAVVVFGSLCIASGINFFLVPFKVLDGGFFGIALIINYLFGANIGLVILLCSLPSFFIAWFRNRGMFYNSISGIIISTLLIEILTPLQYYFLYYIELTPISSAIIGGALIGTGLGVMLRYDISTGGTDLLAKLLAKRVSIHVAVIIFALDGIIIGVGGWLLSGDTLILSALSVSSGGVATALTAWKGAH
jgi:uncharacterized membrane-anchored protein YitT (DUF2179 family)